MAFSVDYSCTLPSSERGEVFSVMTAYREIKSIIVYRGNWVEHKRNMLPLKVCISHLNNSASETHLFTMNLLKL